MKRKKLSQVLQLEFRNNYFNSLNLYLYRRSNLDFEILNNF
jgi:hypothetical protein